MDSGSTKLHIRAPFRWRLLLSGWVAFFALLGIGLWEHSSGFSAQILLEVVVLSAVPSVIALNEAMLEFGASKGELRRKGLFGVRVTPVPITAELRSNRRRVEVWAADKGRLAVLDSRFNSDGGLESRLAAALGLLRDPRGDVPGTQVADLKRT